MVTTRSPRRRTESPKPATKARPSKRGEPLWEMALHAPLQGDWTEAEFLELDRWGVRAELVDGCVEYLPMPSLRHQRVATFLCGLLNAFAKTSRRDAEGVIAPCPLRLWPDHIREPDVFFVSPSAAIDPDELLESAPLVMEVVSEGAKNRKRDLIDKRRDYAKAGIKEYWIVDPQKRTITVLALKKRAYKVHGEFTAGMTATSVLLPGFAVDVDAVFAAGGRRA